jgi:hypothetical protein
MEKRMTMREWSTNRCKDNRRIDTMTYMVIIRFPDDVSKRRALGFLAGRFSFKSWSTGEMMVPAGALPALALEGIPFLAQGPATYEQIATPLRNPPSTALQ